MNSCYHLARHGLPFLGLFQGVRQPGVVRGGGSRSRPLREVSIKADEIDELSAARTAGSFLLARCTIIIHMARAEHRAITPSPLSAHRPLTSVVDGSTLCNEWRLHEKCPGGG